MPNHITNKLKIVGSSEQVKEVLEFIMSDSLGCGTVDFNKITPMPKWVYGSSPDVKGITLADELKWGKENVCLDWARKNWGTKWNAYSQPDKRNTEDTIYFQTAWNGVPDLISKIAWIFPRVTIEYSFADEDTGSSNCGVYQFSEHIILESKEYESCSKEAYELAFELNSGGVIPSYYKFNDVKNTYEYVDED